MPDTDCTNHAECLTPADRALLNAVFGWQMSGAACTAEMADHYGEAGGKTMARQFSAPVTLPWLPLSGAQSARGVGHLARSHTLSARPARVIIWEAPADAAKAAVLAR